MKRKDRRKEKEDFIVRLRVQRAVGAPPVPVLRLVWSRHRSLVWLSWLVLLMMERLVLVEESRVASPLISVSRLLLWRLLVDMRLLRG